MRSRAGGATGLGRSSVPGPWQLSGGISKMQEEPGRGRVQDRLSQEAHSPPEALGTVAALLGKKKKSDLQGGHGSRDQGAKNWKAEGSLSPGGRCRQSRRRKASRTEGEGKTKGARARPAQQRDISDQRNSPPGRQKHRVSIWHKVSTERSKIPLSVIRNVLNQ